MLSHLDCNGGGGTNGLHEKPLDPESHDIMYKDDLGHWFLMNSDLGGDLPDLGVDLPRLVFALFVN